MPMLSIYKPTCNPYVPNSQFELFKITLMSFITAKATQQLARLAHAFSQIN